MLVQVPDVDVVVVPVGGAGLIAGIALAIKTLRPNVMVPLLPFFSRFLSLSLFWWGILISKHINNAFCEIRMEAAYCASQTAALQS